MKRKVWMMILSLLLMLCAGGLAACDESGEPGGPSGEDGHRHALQHVEAVAATCTKDGNIEYWYCPDCGKYFSDAAGTQEAASVAVKAAGHVWEKEWTKDEDAHWHACSVCGEPKEEISHEWGEAVRVKEPSFLKQFPGKALPVKLRSQGGEIDAISGATVSSNGVIGAVAKAVDVYQELKPLLLETWK